MKLFLKYLKERRTVFACFFLFLIIFYICFYLYSLPFEALLYPTLLSIFALIAAVLYDFYRIKKNHKALSSIKSITEAKAYELPTAYGIENDDLRKIIQLISEEHSLFSASAAKDYKDMVDYYTVWVHQIKTPIASMKLNLQNEDTAFSRKLYADLNRIEQYVEMVLTFLRLNSENSDYIIKEYDLDSIIKQAVKKFSYDFIGKKLGLIYEPTGYRVITDEKWLSFVIEQVLSNALKYTKNGYIKITLSDDKKLSVSDTGIGIAPEDLPRIFENGYTGSTGRIDKTASGIGLSLCKRICTNLGHAISAESTVDVGTTITIDLAREKIMVE